MNERMTTIEAARRLGVTPQRVRQMVARGEIESEKIGRDHVITSEALEVAKRRKTTPGPAPRAKLEAADVTAEPDRLRQMVMTARTIKTGARKGGKK